MHANVALTAHIEWAGQMKVHRQRPKRVHEKVRGLRDAFKEIGYFIQRVVSKHIPAVNAKMKPLLQLVDEFQTSLTQSAIDD